MRRQTGVAERGAEGLRDGADQVDGPVAHKRDYRTGAKDEHQSDYWRGNGNRSPDVAPRVSAFAREDSEILKAAQAADRHLTEDRHAKPRQTRQRERYGGVRDGPSA